jgi:hypothetical protein
MSAATGNGATGLYVAFAVSIVVAASLAFALFRPATGSARATHVGDGSSRDPILQLDEPVLPR